jgi:hypothetical protein
MPNPLFEVPSPFDDIEAEIAEAMIDALAEEALDAQSVEINARRAMVEGAESLRLARAL